MNGRLRAGTVANKSEGKAPVGRALRRTLEVDS
jgi:hypothetical protein